MRRDELIPIGRALALMAKRVLLGEADPVTYEDITVGWAQYAFPGEIDLSLIGAEITICAACVQVDGFHKAATEAGFHPVTTTALAYWLVMREVARGDVEITAKAIQYVLRGLKWVVQPATVALVDRRVDETCAYRGLTWWTEQQRAKAGNTVHRSASPG